MRKYFYAHNKAGNKIGTVKNIYNCCLKITSVFYLFQMQLKVQFDPLKFIELVKIILIVQFVMTYDIASSTFCNLSNFFLNFIYNFSATINTATANNKWEAKRYHPRYLLNTFSYLPFLPFLTQPNKTKNYIKYVC